MCSIMNRLYKLCFNDVFILVKKEFSETFTNDCLYLKVLI